MHVQKTFNQLINEEIRVRINFESKISERLESMGVTEIDEKLNGHLIILEDREHIDEDEFQCKYCTDLCYLSMGTCVDHAKKPSDEKHETEHKEAPASKYEQRK